jgi:hypothetical protein
MSQDRSAAGKGGCRETFSYYPGYHRHRQREPRRLLLLAACFAAIAPGVRWTAPGGAVHADLDHLPFEILERTVGPGSR